MLTVSQLAINSGEPQGTSPWVGVYEGAASGYVPVHLYAVVEPALPGSEEYCQELLEAVGRVFHSQKGSLTGRLLQSLKAANEDIREWNRRSLKQHRIAAGVTCLAVRGNEGYMAQVSPASALFFRRNSVVNITPAIPEASEPLGLNDGFWPFFSRLDFGDGERLLVCTSSLPEGVALRDLAAALVLPPGDILPSLYRQVRAAKDFAALVLYKEPRPAV